MSYANLLISISSFLVHQSSSTFNKYPAGPAGERNSKTERIFAQCRATIIVHRARTPTRSQHSLVAPLMRMNLPASHPLAHVRMRKRDTRLPPPFAIPSNRISSRANQQAIDGPIHSPESHNITYIIRGKMTEPMPSSPPSLSKPPQGCRNVSHSALRIRPSNNE